jgi:hypothetical protein
MRSTRAPSRRQHPQPQPPLQCKLPKWAQLRFPQTLLPRPEKADKRNDNDEEYSVDAEERHLCTMAYHAISAHIQDALDKSLEETVGPVLRPALDNLLALSCSKSSSSSSSSIDLLGTESNEDAALPHPLAKRPRCEQTANLPIDPPPSTTIDSTAINEDIDDDLLQTFTLHRRDRSRAVLQEDSDVAAKETYAKENTANVSCTSGCTTASAATGSSTNMATKTTIPQPQSTTISTHSIPTFHSLLLPVLVVDGPFWSLDRLTLVSYLVQSMREWQPRACVVSLIRPSREGNDWLRRTAKAEIHRQCLALEPNAKLRQYCQDLKQRRQQRQGRHSSTATDRLVTWAKRTHAYDSIVVVLHSDHGHDLYHEPTDFVQWLASRRAHYGIPMVLVVMGPCTSFRRPLSLLPTSLGLLVRTVTVPSSRDILNGWYLHCFHAAPQQDVNSVWTPPRHVLAGWAHSFAQQQASVSQTVARYRQHVAHVLGVPGSHWSVAGLLGTTLGESRRLTLLLCDKAAMTRSPVATEPRCSYTALLEWLVKWEVQRRTENISSQLTSQIHNLVAPPSEPYLFWPLRNTDRDDLISVKESDRRALLVTLFNIRKNLSQSESTFASLDLLPGDRAPYEAIIREQTLRTVNEQIVLLDQCTTLAMVLSCLNTADDALLPSPWPTTPMPSEPEYSPQPRRDVVSALLEDPPSQPISSLDQDAYDNAIPGDMYRIILDRASISESEWFHAFVHATKSETHGSGRDSARQFACFACGARYLEVCGLIRRRCIVGKSGSNASAVYEKTALVWCSGD